MRFSLKQLKKMSVVTASGISLGVVADLVLDTEGQMVVQYVVKKKLSVIEYCLIGREQVVRFEEKKMVVDDAVASEKKSIMSPLLAPTRPEPVAMREG